jgi:hypothetical protein
MSKNMGMLGWAFKKRAGALGLVGVKEPRLSFRSFIESYPCPIPATTD